MAFLAFHRLPPLHALSASPRTPEPVQLVFSPSQLEAGGAEEPKFFTQLPTNRADSPPEKSRLLSNVTSRARDQIPGGDTDLPRMQGESDMPTVKLEKEQAASAPAQPTAPPQPSEPQPPTSGDTWKKSILLTRDPNAAKSQRESPGSPGGSDIDQMEMVNPDGNAGLTGDVSLNTTAWEYAPWLERFRNQLMERWYAPPAYYMGILKEGGWAVIEVEISKSGKMLRLDLLEQQGHPSLIRNAQSALRSIAPIEPLPADFPEPTLILRIRMIYPRIRPR